MNFAPAWSPDGSKMILTLSMDGNPDLYLLDKRGEIIDKLTNKSGINVSPTWSPDGSRIAFVSDRAGRAKPQLYVMDLRTRKTQRITFEGSENAEPSWSPTEDLLVYSSLRGGVYQLYTVKPEAGATPTPVTKDLSHHESPQWSPDGNQIIFSKRDGKLHQIYAIMKNGSEQRRLLPFRVVIPILNGHAIKSNTRTLLRLYTDEKNITKYISSCCSFPVSHTVCYTR